MSQAEEDFPTRSARAMSRHGQEYIGGYERYEDISYHNFLAFWLKDEACANALLRFAAAEFSDQNIRFILDMMRFREENPDTYIEKKTSEFLYHTKSISSHMEQNEYAISIFDDALEEIYILVSEDTLQRFKHTPAYMEQAMVRKLAGGLRKRFSVPIIVPMNEDQPKTLKK